MKARIVIPTASGERLSYDLQVHHSGSAGRELRIIFATNEEKFERWLFYLLRDVGAFIVSDEPKTVRDVLALAPRDPGVLSEAEVTAHEVPIG